MVGRMPRNICNAVHVGMQIHRNIDNAACFTTGNIFHEAPVPGGGPQLEAVYLIEFNGTERDLQTMCSYIRRFLNSDSDIFI